MSDHIKTKDRAGTDLDIAAEERLGVQWPLNHIVDATGVKVNPSSEETNQALLAAIGQLLEAVNTLASTTHSMNRSIGMATVDIAARLRVILDAASVIGTVNNVTTVATVTTVGTATTVGTVNNVANQTLNGGYSAAYEVPSLMASAVAGLRNNIVVS